jgi:outer membrane protein assembly factor BamA
MISTGRSACIAFAFVVLGLGALGVRAGESDIDRYQGRIIRRIDIVRKNVFDDQIERSDLFIYRWANALHFVTRESVIRRELLFSAGDSLDAERVLESQRNIRLTELIEDVDVKAIPVGDDSVDLEIVSSDLWTTKLSPMFETGGGNSKIGLLFAEKNFLGGGRLVETTAQTGTDQDGFSILYRDRRVGGSRIAAGVGYSDFTYDRRYSVQLDKPRYALSVHSRFSAGYGHGEGTTRLFDGGDEYFRYRYTADDVHAEAAYTFGTRSSIDLIAAYDYTGRVYRRDAADTSLGHAIPPDEVLSYPSLGTGAAYTRYGVERYLDEAGTPEDLTYGAAVRAMTGRSSKRLGADYEGWINAVAARVLAKPLPRLIVGASDAVSWQESGGERRRIHHTTEGFAYIKTGGTQVLAMRGLVDFAWRERPTYQLLLGGDNGLRGYKYYSLSGDRMALANVEYRFYVPVEILSVRLGGAAFFDCGNVWRTGETIDLSRLKSDLGIGLRLGLTKSSTARIVSVDLARSLTEPRYYVTVTSGLVFSLSSLGN